MKILYRALAGVKNLYRAFVDRFLVETVEALNRALRVAIVRTIAVAVLVLFGTVLSAQGNTNPFEQVSGATDTIQNIAKAVGAILGGLITLIGGGIAAWKASKGEDFTKQLIFAIVGFVIALAAISLL